MLAAALAFLGGLLIGSFLNVCIYRWPRDLSVVRPRSFCPACNHPVAWYDNLPLLSYALLGGRCRHCGKSISLRYPLVELLTAVLLFVIVFSYGPTLPAVKWCLFSALLVGLIFSDLEERILPDELTLGGLVAGLLLAVVAPSDPAFVALVMPAGWGRVWPSVGESLLGAGLSAGLLWLVGTLYLKVRGREGLGFGDVKMVAMIGAFLGLEGTLLAVVLGSILGSVLGLIYIFATRKQASTYELPFGTFLGSAALLVVLLRDPILSALGRLGG
jgi:leader peptidase (prepilin peptidase)/N-methyltransferase